MGRQTTFTKKIADAICERIAQGEPLMQICRDEGFPADRTVRDWIVSNESFAADIARAREAGFDAIAESCLEIADDARNDFMERQRGEDEAPLQVLNAEHVQRSKLRIETRLKLLAKWSPKRYGEKLEVAGPGPNGEHAAKVTVEFVSSNP